MNPISSLRRSVSRMVAGAFFAALFALGSVPALALTVTKVGSLPGDPLKFTITLDNLNGPFATGTPLVLDPLPGIGTVVWTLGDTGGFFCEMLTGLDFPHTQWGPLVDFPDDQQVISCDGSGLDVGESTSIVVNGTVTQSTCSAWSLINEALVVTGSYDDIYATGTIDINGGGSDCRMTGGGSIFTAGKGSTRVTHGFELRCDPLDPRQNLEINWAGGGKNQSNFHLTSLTTARCVDTGLDQKPPKSSEFDTFIGAGEGTCNGKAATIEFVFTDAGEPGTLDTAYYAIDGDDNACDLVTVPRNLTKGNQQAH